MFARGLGQPRTSDSIGHTETGTDALLNMPLPSCDADVEISKATSAPYEFRMPRPSLVTK